MAPSDYSGLVRKAVILAAGRGTRLESRTGGLPKPMIEIGGRPMIEHVLDRLRRAGIEAARIVTGWRAEAIERYLPGYPMEISFRRQEPLDGTATAALLARDFIGPGEGFLLTYGDILADPDDYRAMAAMLDGDPDADAVVAVQRVDDPWQGAAVYERDGRLTAIVEKPPPGASTTPWNSAGIYAFRPGVFDEMARVPLSPRGEYELTSAVSQSIAAGRKLLLYALRGRWRDVGRPEDLDAAGEML